MKSLLIRIGALTLSFTVGVAISLLITNHRSCDATITPVNFSSPECPSTDGLLIKGGFVVISVPNDDEFYIGKQKVEACQSLTEL
jgi:hypothetical protein